MREKVFLITWKESVPRNSSDTRTRTLARATAPYANEPEITAVICCSCHQLSRCNEAMCSTHKVVTPVPYRIGLRRVRMRTIHGTIRRLLDVGRMWAKTVGLPHCFLDLRSGESFGFEKLDTLCQ
jgi:hypothetical protein